MTTAPTWPLPALDLLGVTVYALAWSAELTGPLATWGCVALIAGLRILGLTRGWQVPAPRRLRA